MLTCITCSKQRMEEGEEEGVRGTPSTKEAVKSLTAQIKDMASKFSGAYKQCKPCTGSSSYKKGQQPFRDFDTISEGVPYMQPGSSSSTPAWDFTTSGHHPTIGASRFAGDRTPRGLESVICPVW
ncbi:hypothetical protein F0562_011906 [Nyssa sinensis]|uniref:Transcription factor BREVIS RADIX N-terminal domain-containing protein n=1 Tax=Nyssa sinensis TaxID=561372 RepID=A0A5J4ZVW4_9ASTE|nr:hypothetical protein F0562_011906 [Nyssa sinensis]